ncbi:hypothetical protein [Novosphingobium cyanobacteriorum]|uniref:Uncharacterized protein n=1 Tax=Novosphingobium cyanobacteriorum TaxID=3024215 RepID=A0ABT6CNF3_9SPHN|nr:hypothetical protein [Novosphingobium cyanobacteriorum]MDF8335044.1 hypothetical protein [Novosphingobium cyanobacteriorum]
MSVAGQYTCVTKTPMGDQASTLTVVAEGDRFTGSNAGAMGSMDITDGAVSGNTLSWTSMMTSPMPITLECTATVEGDSISGTVKAGMFGSFPMTGSRTG